MRRARTIAAVRRDAATDWARSGVMALTGQRDGPPLVPPGNAATVANRVAAATGLPVDGAALLAERAGFTGHVRRGRVSAGGACRLLPTADGWAAVSCARPDDPSLLAALVGAELPDDPWPALAGWLRAHPGAELAERAALLGVAAAPVPAHPATTKSSFTAAGLASSLLALTAKSSFTAAGLASSLLALTALPRPGTPRSVAGLLVVDFSALWAGPLCAHLLGLAGARVVKVETPQRPDGARRGNPDFYRLLHAGHRAVMLDPATPGGRRSMSALVQAADIVIEASRPRALAGFGLDAEAVAERGAIWVSITAAGRNSPRVGFGDDVAAGAGLVAYDERREPVFCGDALADPLTGLVAAELALTAPDHGRGRLFDVSMSAVVAATLGAAPSFAARPAGNGWVVDTAHGPVPVAAPRHRTVTGHAPEPGEHTAAVLGELGIPVP
jgi:crotonobetainyl-CoA:carnitine CoA-transferase CaiB-like acyl-CoA transferase